MSVGFPTCTPLKGEGEEANNFNPQFTCEMVKTKMGKNTVIFDVFRIFAP